MRMCQLLAKEWTAESIVQIGVASFLLNYAVAYYKRTGDTDGQIQTLSVIIITMLPHIRGEFISKCKIQ